MSDEKVGVLFPAFGMKYRDFEGGSLQGYEEEATHFIRLAGKVVDLDPQHISHQPKAKAEDDVAKDQHAHYSCYINSCTISSLLKKRGIAGDYTAGYSMGLFAALYHCGATSFEEGLLLMHNTSILAHEAVKDAACGMGVVVGLTCDEVHALIEKHCPSLEIADVCNEHVIIVSGKRFDLTHFLKVAGDMGCIQAKMMPVALPYHSTMMRDVEHRIQLYLQQVTIRKPQCPLISCVDQRILSTEEDVRREAGGNVGHPIHWQRTMNKMLSLGVKVFIECGLSEGLCKLARFFEGNFRVYHPKKFSELFNGAPATEHALGDHTSHRVAV